MPEKKVDKNKNLIMTLISLKGFKFDENGKGEIQLLQPGRWDHPAYGMVEITTETLNDFVNNFKKNLRAHSNTVGLPVDEEHNTTGGAVGWIKKLINRGSEGLFAIVEWNTKGQQMIKDAVYRFFSPEFYFQYEDPETRKVYNNVLIGGALTNRPYFKGLNPVVLSENNLINNKEKIMQLSELSKKSLADLSNDEKSFVTSHFSELDEAGKTKFAELKPASTFKEGDTCKMADGSEGKMVMENGKLVCMVEKPAKKANEMSETEIIKLREDAAQGAKAMAEVRKMNLDKKVEGFVYSETNKDKGKIPATLKEKAVEFALTLNEEQETKFFAFIDGLPVAKLFVELGGSGDGGNKTQAPAGVDQASFDLDLKAKELQASDKNLSYDDALVMAEKGLAKK